MAEIDLVLSVARLVDELRKKGAAPTDEDWDRLATVVSSGFNTRKDEVAILRVSADGKMLSFLLPVKLAIIGLIPLSAAHSLAVKNIRERRGEIVNNFPAYKHPTVFEAVDLSPKEKAVPIQKIMSSPMIMGGKVVGVIQISRKARPGDPVGPDFTPAELGQLATAGSVIGKYISELPASTFSHSKSPTKP